MLLHQMITFLVWRSFIEQPARLNSTEQLLSELNWRTDIRFLIRFGETRTLLKCKKVGKCATPVDVTGKREQLPAIIEKGKDEFGKVVCERMNACGVI